MWLNICFCTQVQKFVMCIHWLELFKYRLWTTHSLFINYLIVGLISCMTWSPSFPDYIINYLWDDCPPMSRLHLSGVNSWTVSGSCWTRLQSVVESSVSGSWVFIPMWNLDIITSAMGGFASASICCWQNNSERSEWILLKGSRTVDKRPRKRWFNFDDVLNSGGILTFNILRIKVNGLW